MEWINYTLFTLGNDYPVLLIDLITSVLGLICVFLAGRNSKYNFWVGYLYTAALFLMFWNKNLYASLLLQPISLAINVLGHWRWTHPRENETSSEDSSALKVSMLSWPERFICIAAVFRILLFLAVLAVPGFLRDRADPGRPIAFRPQEVGLLDRLAGGQRRPDHPAPVRRPCLHADRLRPVPGQRPVVPGLLDETLQEKSVI